MRGLTQPKAAKRPGVTWPVPPFGNHGVKRPRVIRPLNFVAAMRGMARVPEGLQLLSTGKLAVSLTERPAPSTSSVSVLR